MADEKKKMLMGELYNPHDKILVAERLNAKALCRELNTISPEQFKQRKAVVKKLFSEVSSCYIEPNFFCDYGHNISLGKRFYANHNCVILDAAQVTIGDNVMFGPNVQILTINHPLDMELRLKEFEIAQPISIGNNVWIGGGAIILPGVTLGEGVVVAAGSVVTKSVADKTVVAGNPARLVKTLC